MQSLLVIFWVWSQIWWKSIEIYSKKCPLRHNYVWINIFGGREVNRLPKVHQRQLSFTFSWGSWVNMENFFKCYQRCHSLKYWLNFVPQNFTRSGNGDKPFINSLMITGSTLREMYDFGNGKTRNSGWTNSSHQCLWMDSMYYRSFLTNGFTTLKGENEDLKPRSVAVEPTCNLTAWTSPGWFNTQSFDTQVMHLWIHLLWMVGTWPLVAVPRKCCKLKTIEKIHLSEISNYLDVWLHRWLTDPMRRLLWGVGLWVA